jgi:formylglycine-generating enzyme required for sulfatase activity
VEFEPGSREASSVLHVRLHLLRRRAGQFRFAVLVLAAIVGLVAFSLANLLGRGGARRVPTVVAVDRSDPLIQGETPQEINSLGMLLIPISPTTFTMGSGREAPNAPADEQPRRTIVLTRPFALGAFEVTRGEFRAFVEATGYVTEGERVGVWGHVPATGAHEQRRDFHWRQVGFPQNDRHPVVAVTWNDALAFCEWLSKKEGRLYTLPTEAEWEYVCRAGHPQRWHGGETGQGISEIGNVADELAHAVFPNWRHTLAAEDGFTFTAPVGEYAPNPWGFHDLHGNVWEWCADWYDPTYYAQGKEVDPEGPAAGTERVIRGGAWSASPRSTRPTSRASRPPSYASDSIGFRVCLRELVPASANPASPSPAR